MNLTQIKHAVKMNGGATLTSELDGATLNGGYMVSLHGHELKTSIDLLTFEMLEDYKQIAECNNAYIGFWMDGADLYVDVSINVHEEAEALKIAQDNKQLAIYNISKGESVYL